MKSSKVKLMLRTVWILCVVALLSATGAANPRLNDNDRQDNNRDRELVVMTRNMYLGTDFGPILSATTFPEFAQRVADAYIEVQHSNIPERAAALALEIDRKQPHLIGLQEASIWRTGPFGGPATTVQFDALKSLLEELDSLGLHYTPIEFLGWNEPSFTI